jgi:hypothetical protein
MDMKHYPSKQIEYVKMYKLVQMVDNFNHSITIKTK